MPLAGSRIPTHSRTLRWTPPVLWVSLILVGTSWPAISVGPDTPAGLDKVVHFTMYAVLGALVLRATRSYRRARTQVLVLLVLSAFGAIDEYHQEFIPRRSASVLDWVADSLGALTGVLAVRFIPQLAPRRQGSAT
jgi:VanZ family protein